MRSKTLFSALFAGLLLWPARTVIGAPDYEATQAKRREVARKAASTALAEPIGTQGILRVNLRGSYSCAGVVISTQGHILIPAGCVGTHADSLPDNVTVGRERIPAAAFIAVNDELKLSVIRADVKVKPLPIPRNRPLRGTQLTTHFFKEGNGEPITLVRTVVGLVVTDPVATLELPGETDLENVMLTDTTTLGLPHEGFNQMVVGPKGTFEGIIIGRTDYGNSQKPIIFPADRIAAWLESQKIPIIRK